MFPARSQVEGDVGNYWRTLYKLEKGFGDVPKALNIATTVKATVEEFREHIPIVQVRRKLVFTQDRAGYHPNPDRSVVMFEAITYAYLF